MICLFEVTARTISQYPFGQTTLELIPSFIIEADALSVAPYAPHYTLRGHLSNGVISSIEHQPEHTKIVVWVRTTDEDGEFRLAMSRDLIDSRLDGCFGADGSFKVFVDGVKDGLEETQTTSKGRRLVIPIPAGTEKV